MKNAVQCIAGATVALAVFCGCGGAYLDMPPSVVSDDKQYVDIENATVDMVGRNQVVRVRLAIYEPLPSDLLYDIIATKGGQGGDDVVVKQDVPSGVDGSEPGSRTTNPSAPTPVPRAQIARIASGAQESTGSTRPSTMTKSFPDPVIL